jgi:hypothetical protein
LEESGIRRIRIWDSEESGIRGFRNQRNLSLTVITLTVGVIYTNVFEYKNQVMFNMTVFDGGPRCHIDTCFWYPNEDVVFGILKPSHFSI